MLAREILYRATQPAMGVLQDNSGTFERNQLRNVNAHERANLKLKATTQLAVCLAQPATYR